VAVTNPEAASTIAVTSSGGAAADAGNVRTDATTSPTRSSSATVVTVGSMCTPIAKCPVGCSRSRVRGLPRPAWTSVPASVMSSRSSSRRVMLETDCAERPVSSASSTRDSPSGAWRMASRITAWLKSATRGRLVPRLPSMGGW
jgi:hypothetical protein